MLYTIYILQGAFLSWCLASWLSSCRCHTEAFWTGATSASGLLFGLDVNRAWNPSRGPSSLSFYYLLTRYDSPNSPRRRRRRRLACAAVEAAAAVAHRRHTVGRKAENGPVIYFLSSYNGNANFYIQVPSGARAYKIKDIEETRKWSQTAQ